MVSRVKELREERGLSQQNLADLIGVSRQTVYFLENKAYNPSLTISFKISEIFEKPIEEIFYFEPEIQDIVGGKTGYELKEISESLNISQEELLGFMNIEDEELVEYPKNYLEKLAKALGKKFEDLFEEE